MEYSKYQKDIFDFIEKSKKSLVISALAGSGKTTTIVKALSKIPKGKSILMIAFNRAIADELKKKVPSNIDVRTFNSLGASSLFSTLGETTLDNNKTSKIAIETVGGYKTAAMFKAIPLVNHAKNYGIVPKTVKGFSFMKDEEESWDFLIDHFNLEFGNIDRSTVITLARNILEDSISAVSKKKLIDFADQIYIPVIKNLKMKQYDYVIIDEVQDISKLQIYMIKKSLKKDGRVIAVGDRNQAIYGFRGASTEAFDAVVNLFKCEVLPLSVSYRCASSIIKEANSLVPDILPRDNAPKGSVKHIESWSYKDIKTEDSMILCRNNAPLFDVIYYLIANNVPCVMNGSDVSKNITSFINDLKATTLPDLRSKLDIWEKRKISSLMNKQRFYMIDAIQDKCSCVRSILDNTKSKTIKGIISEVESFFEEKNKQSVLLSTCHKSKGLEAETVYILNTHLFPSKMAKKPWEFVQENNLLYVAITRAKNELYYIDSFGITKNISF